MKKASLHRFGRRLATIATASLAPLAAAPTAAHAADTGKVYDKTLRANNGPIINGCSKAEIADGGAGGVGVAWTYSYEGDSVHQDCAGSTPLPAGYLGSTVAVFRSGIVCDVFAVTNSSKSAAVGAPAACDDHAGVQKWFSWSRPKWFKGQYCTPADQCSGGYVTGPLRKSPDLYF